MNVVALIAASQWARIVVLGALLVAIVVFVCWLDGAQSERRDRCRAAGGTYLVRENVCLDGVRVRP